MIVDWLKDRRLDRFLAEHFQREPAAGAGTARDAASALDWNRLTALVRGVHAPDVLLVESGRLHGEMHPASGGQALALFARGWSIVIRRAEDHDGHLHRLAESVADELGMPVTIHVFATPRQTHAFGWHYDAEDVFLVQAEGEKQFFLRRNTVNPAPTAAGMPKNLGIERETSAIAACRLVPGDWLYVPSGWWHVARSLENSLTISIGVMSPRARGE